MTACVSAASAPAGAGAVHVRSSASSMTPYQPLSPGGGANGRGGGANGKELGVPDGTVSLLRRMHLLTGKEHFNVSENGRIARYSIGIDGWARSARK